jgi:hypothetical protein
MECTYCKNTFSNNNSLICHQKTAKYCLEMQGIKKNTYMCDSCDKILSTKNRLLTHYISCIKHNQKNNNVSFNMEKQQLLEKIQTLESLLTKKDEHIEKLESKLENLAIKAIQKSTTTIKNTNINYIQKMEPITKEHLVTHCPQLTIEHIKKGASGYAEYALGGPLKDRIACVDYSRRKIKFKDREGNLITDPEMSKLAPMFFDSIKDKNSQLVYSLNNSDMDSSMFEEVAKLFNTNADVKNGAIGIKTDFYHDFIKQVCSGSVVD